MYWRCSFVRHTSCFNVPFMGKRKKIGILGSTGSIGTQTLEVLRHFSSEFEVVALSAGSNTSLLEEQSAEHPNAALWVRTPREVSSDSPLSKRLTDCSLSEFVHRNPAELWVVATVGWAGVEPTLAALESGAEIALANKEVLVCAGELVMKKARAKDIPIWPIDSEHNALMQCLDAGRSRGEAPVRRLLLTCSGGPFRDASPEVIAAATAAQTLRHPTWDMGAKITVDSSTLMNKGFEVIEAYHLFGIPLDQIEVVIHPQSIIHSMVEFVDGSILAQLGLTDMRLPIQNILTQPHRRPTPLPSLNFATLGKLEFSSPDLARFPCLQYAYDCARRGGTYPCVLNAANEVAVAAHLANRITNGQIPLIIQSVLAQHSPPNSSEANNGITLDVLQQADAWARQTAEKLLSVLTDSIPPTNE